MNGTEVQEGFFKRNGKKIVITIIAIVSAVVLMVGGITFYNEILLPWLHRGELKETLTDAGTMISACKITYAGVRNGTITSEDKEYDGDLCIWAPRKGENEEIRYQTASKVTIQEAMEYNGVTGLDISDMYYFTEDTEEYSKGDIEWYGEDKQTEYDTIRKLEYDTTLGELYDGKK